MFKQAVIKFKKFWERIMKNNILAVSLSVVLSILSPVYAQNAACSAINYDVAPLKNGQFDAKEWLKQANDYAKQSENIESLNQSLYLYVNLLEDNSLAPDLIIEAFQGANALLMQHSASIDMECVIVRFTRLSQSYMDAAVNEFVELKPDPRIIKEIEVLKGLLVEMPLSENLDIQNVMILANWGNTSAIEMLKVRAQNPQLPYFKLLQERLNDHQETVETIASLEPLTQQLTDAEKLELYEVLRFYVYSRDDAIQAKAKEISRQLLVDNPHIVTFQDALVSYTHKDLNGLTLLRPIVTESSPVESQIILASLLYREESYQESYQLLKKLADGGNRTALANLVSDLFMYKGKIPLSDDEIMAWVNTADDVYQKTHDPELVDALYKVYKDRVLDDMDYKKFLSYIQTGIFSEFYVFLEERHKLYEDVQEYMEVMEKIQTLIANGDQAQLKQLWENDRYSSMFRSPKVLKQMADLGVSQSQFLLALKYEEAQNLSEAFQYFLKAADNGNENAKMAVTYAYMRGEGTDQNREKAIYYFNFMHRDNNEDSGYGSYEKSQYVYPTMYQWMKESPNEEAIMNLDKQKYLFQSIRLDKDAPMFFIMEDVEKL